MFSDVRRRKGKEGLQNIFYVKVQLHLAWRLEKFGS